MRPFAKDTRPRKTGDDKKFGPRDTGTRTFRSRDQERPKMYKATCGQCGNMCEVPFKPTGTRPVLCDVCFKGESARTSRSDRPDRAPYSDRRAPRGESSSYRSRGTDQQGDELKKINAKLDAILRLLS